MHRSGRSESATFAYRTDFLSRPGAYACDPDLPLTSGQFQTAVGQSLFGAFADTAPDRWGRTLLQRTEAASAREEHRTARTFAERAHLLGARDDMRQGALRYRHPGEDRFVATEDTGVPALLQLGVLLNAADALDRDHPSDHLRVLLRGGSSLGGARPKAHVSGVDGHPPSRSSPALSTTTGTSIGGEASRSHSPSRPGLVVADHAAISWRSSSSISRSATRRART